MLCELISKAQPSEGVFDYTIECHQMAIKAKPGQFLHILCGGDSYLRRPISICDVIDTRLIRFIFQVKGEGTKALSRAKVGERMDVLGPLGNGFDYQQKAEQEGDCVLIGGGIGIFPLLGLARRMKDKPVVMLGFRNTDSMLLTGEFSVVARSLYVSSDDGSVGVEGNVTDILKHSLSMGSKISKIYTCGPKPMMKAVAEIARENNIACEASLEERMGCGVGACVTCTCTMTDGSRKRVCKDGPVFNALEVDFDG